MIAKVWERLAVSKKAAQKFDVEEFNLKKLSVLELRKPQIKISIRFALKNLDDSEDRKGFGKALMSVSWNSIGKGSNYCTVI